MLDAKRQRGFRFVICTSMMLMNGQSSFSNLYRCHSFEVISRRVSSAAVAAIIFRAPPRTLGPIHLTADHHHPLMMINGNKDYIMMDIYFPTRDF